MNGQDDRQQIFDLEFHNSDWFKTNDSKAFAKSQGLELSQDLDRLQFDPLLQFEQDNWNLNDINRKANRKQQNRQNSKRAREKKKQDFQHMKERILQLERQNLELRSKKICTWCKRSLNGFHQHYAQICHQISQQPNKNMNKELIFQEMGKQKKRNNVWNPKVWIALGVIMLIIGLQIFGVGQQEHPIKIRQKDMKNWVQKIYQEGPGTINIKMKSKIPQMATQKKFKQKQQWKEKIKWMERVHIENQEDYQMNEDQQIQQTQLNIDKDLLYSIQAEFDDIGRYI